MYMPRKKSSIGFVSVALKLLSRIQTALERCSLEDT
jgi:hypothetical protein